MALAETLPQSSSSFGPETGGTLRIDLAAIEANWRTLTRALRGAECAAVVKANAYGLGLEQVGAKLAGAGCKTFFVADLTEARRLRPRAREAAIYVLNGFTADAGPAFVELAARPVINSTTELAEWDAFVAQRRWRGGAALHVDTGMNRLGVPADTYCPRPVSNMSAVVSSGRPMKARKRRSPTAATTTWCGWTCGRVDGPEKGTEGI